MAVAAASPKRLQPEIKVCRWVGSPSETAFKLDNLESDIWWRIHVSTTAEDGNVTTAGCSDPKRSSSTSSNGGAVEPRAQD